MPQKSANKNLSNPKTLQFHQIGNRQGQQSKSSPPNQRVLILSTPIKLKDGTINMEQRTIPLRIDNSQLTITATENKNKIVSLKRGIEPPPLALPINQLNKKSTTFVKNEVGQVMGKLIPLGKFSNITRNTLAPISTASSSSATPTTGAKNLKHNVANPRENKVIKLEEDLKESLNSKEKTNPNSTSETRAKNTAMALSAILPKVEKAKDPVVTITESKPKKRVHLVLKGYENIASIGQTGTKIKLIPLNHWKLDEKSNLLKTQLSGSIISQPKIVDVRSCTVDEMDGSEVAHFHGNKLDCNFHGKEDFDIDNILEKDPLDIGEMLSKETETLTHSLERNSSKNDVQLKTKPELTKQTYAIDKPDSIRTISESGRVNSSKILTLAKGGMSIELKYDNKLRTPSVWPKKNNVLLKTSIADTKSSETVAENVKKVDPVINSLVENVKDETEIRKIDVNHDELYKRFGISKDDITAREAAMLSYICSLKKKLAQSQKSRVQALTALQPREYLGNNNLSNIQKRFVESQLRNSGRIKKKQRFIKTDLVMARDVLKATGPRGYSNLRKLFSLPDMSAVVKGISKT